MKAVLSEKWIKASIIGTIWAASEIVLGSFLHNLRIPFSGNILTAIGIVILISVNYKWTEKGLFWRAGLICAIMKTMSPSAVIFGPMIAIFSEAIIMELSIRLFGRTIAGYVSGAILAMSWNLFQKIANYIIFYGNNIVEVYTNLLRLAQKQLHIETDIVWLPVIVLLVAYALFGLVSATIGIMAGRRLIKTPAAAMPLKAGNYTSTLNGHGSKKEFSYSLWWLIADITLMIISFLLLSFAPWPVWSITISVVVTLWALRYKRALRQLSKPKFWIFFVLITLITAFAFVKTNPGENILLAGLLTGFQMNFRAVVVIVGFAVIGTELYNPVIREFFLKTSFKHLPLAVELSVESLPSFIAEMPDLKTIIRDPVSVFCGFFSHAEQRLKEIKNGHDSSHKVFIVNGPVGKGKTSYIKNLVKMFKEDNIAITGIISERVVEGAVTVGYDLVDIDKGEKKTFLRLDHGNGMETIGRFCVYSEGMEMGRKALRRDGVAWQSITVIDEVGNLELRDRGWSESISHLLSEDKSHLLISVRDSLTKEVIDKWSLQNPIIFNIAETDSLKAYQSIVQYLNG